jgi:hypothetical protein
LITGRYAIFAVGKVMPMLGERQSNRFPLCQLRMIARFKAISAVRNVALVIGECHVRGFGLGQLGAIAGLAAALAVGQVLREIRRLRK